MNPNFKTLLKNPIHMLAFGFGSGLSPRLPGSVGSLLALALYFPLYQLGWVLYGVIVILATLFGFWLCGRSAADLGQHDYEGIVWDEFVGMWITLFLIPPDWYWLTVGYLLFRLLDIAKPWPIKYFDRSVGGGFGIMMDDIIAGILACLGLHALRLLLL